jgi:hypothetical protein
MANSQQEIVLLCLQDGEWVLGSRLVRESTPYGYLGKNGDRRARELERLGQIRKRYTNKLEVEYQITDAGLRRLGLDDHLPEQRPLFEEAK